MDSQLFIIVFYFLPFLYFQRALTVEQNIIYYKNITKLVKSPFCNHLEVSLFLYSIVIPTSTIRKQDNLNKKIVIFPNEYFNILYSHLTRI